MLVPVVLILYFLTSIGFILYLFTRNIPILTAARLSFILCVTAHLTFIIALGIRMQHIPLSSPAQGMNMMVFIASVVFMSLVWKKATTVLMAFYLPIATFAIGLIAPSIGQEPGVFIESSQYWYGLHTLSVIGGEALFVVAFITSVVYLIHERIIRKGRIHAAASGLPPLAVLDKILYSCLSLGFVAISIGMIMGALWASSLDVSLESIAPKASAGAIMWFVFALGVHQRFAIGWRGSRTAIITVIGFCLMIIGFIGVNLAFPNAHGIGLLP
ncbi:MAG TPA: cytochrome c biogenesis protein CcsA [Deltaproteobacteria bacterium]|nr:cytochrome c biogenesis protein CcsA [Deltaproteobacteria bacterium]HPJ93270.1 cytochrome c biogenesis protein CcsA [Deltaproteobacteria bacterium]HPR52236.1 cytochrome c biogenesis protein CcsA [Deltaproteobacteria bacterium]